MQAAPSSATATDSTSQTHGLHRLSLPRGPSPLSRPVVAPLCLRHPVTAHADSENNNPAPSLPSSLPHSLTHSLPACSCLFLPQYLGRFALTLDPLNPLAFTKTTTPVLNPDLDPLLTMPCTQSTTGQCSPPKDTIIVLPNSYTRIGFNTPLEAGLYVWHWCAVRFIRV